MQAGKAWHSLASLGWLQKVLRERFGNTFVLQLRDGHTLRILLPGDERKIELSVDNEMFTRADSDLPCAQWEAITEGWTTLENRKLPAPGAEHLPKPLFEAVAFGYKVHYDVLGMAYWMLSRQEEVGRTDLDKHGRFSAVVSHAYRHGYLERPIVDEWLCVLGQAMQRVWPQLVLTQHSFCINVSHDVDRPSLYGFQPWWAVGRMMAGHIIKRHDLHAFLTAARVKLGTSEALHPDDPFNTFDWLMDQSEANGLKSAFYFICGHTDECYDADYMPEHPALRQLMACIHARGHEIGLHPSYGSYQRSDVIAEELKRLRRVADGLGIAQAKWGGRMHYLRWEQPTTLRACAEAGMDYDSSMGYPDQPGFRCGSCFEYPAFDPVTCNELPLRVRPLIAMESTVIESADLGIEDVARVKKKFEQLRSACAYVGGGFSLLWHNSSLVDLSVRNVYAYAMRARGGARES